MHNPGEGSGGGHDGGQGQQDQGHWGGGPHHHDDEREEEDQDHAEETARAWERAFWEALHEVRVGLLKTEIEARFGGHLKEVAKGVAEAMHAEWREYWAEQEEKLKPETGARRRIKDLIKKSIAKSVSSKGRK